MAIKIQVRGDTAANWTAANPVLAERELAAETDTQKFKLGDGVTAWASLPYCSFVPDFARVAASVVGGVLTLDLAAKVERKFEVGTAQSSAFSIAFASSSSAEIFTVTIPITGTVPITLPSNVLMEKADTRFVNGTKILTLIGGTAEPFELSFNVMTGPKYLLKASSPYYAS